MKIIIRYDLASIPPVERGDIPDSFAGKVFPVMGEDRFTYRIKCRHGRKTTYDSKFILKSLCSPHKQRTRHDKVNNSSKNNH